MADAEVITRQAPQENSDLVRSHAEENSELVAAFDRYLIARGNAPSTIRAYLAAVSSLVESMGAKRVAEANRNDVRQFLAELCGKGLDTNTVRLRTASLRAFFKFLRLSGASQIDPMIAIPHRKVPRRLQRVLTAAEFEALIAAARNPFERAVLEVLYATGVRVSELVNISLADVDFRDGDIGWIRVEKGKGRKDRIVPFGRKAAEAIQEYQKWRPSKTGILFEAKSEIGCVYRPGLQWWARVSVSGKPRQFKIGPVSELNRDGARRVAEAIISKIPGYDVRPARAYTTRTIALLVNRVAKRAGLGRVHPHMLRRAAACHLIQNGANIRAVQEFLGHDLLTTTALYTHLTAADLKRAHSSAHPHGGDDGERAKG